MTVECPLCGKEVSSHYYLGQHIDKKDDNLHNGEKAEEIAEDGGNPGNLVEEWKEDTTEDTENTEENESMKVNEIPTADVSENTSKTEYKPIDDVNVEGLSESEVNLLVKAKKQGYTQIEDNDEPINQRDVK